MPDAVDFSSWTSVPTPAQLDCLKKRGVRMAIIGTRGNREAHFRAQVIACQDAGLAVETYIYLYFAEDAQLQTLDALKKMAGLGIRRVWMDVEGVPQGQGKTIASLADVEQLLRQAGYDVGIYTSQSKWPAHTGNTTLFKHLALWDAHWRYPSGDARGIAQAPPAFVPYGGWVKPAIVQYVGDVRYCDLNLDLNMVYEEQAVEEDEDMKPFLCWSGRVIFVGPAGPRWITNPAVVKELARTFNQPLDPVHGLPLIGLSGAAILAMGGVPPA